jgi:hypothetical protein
MFALLAILFFAASVIVHGGFASIHSHWFGWTGLALLGLLCLALSNVGPQLSQLRRKQQQ